MPKNFFTEGTIDINIVIFLPPADLESSFQVMHPKRSSGALSFNVVDEYAKESARGSYPFDWDKFSLIRPLIKSETNDWSNSSNRANLAFAVAILFAVFLSKALSKPFPYNLPLLVLI